MIPFIHFDAFVEKLKLGYTGFGEFKYASHFFLVDSNGSKLNRVRRADWIRAMEEQPVVITTSRVDRNITAVMKYNFAHSEPK